MLRTAALAAGAALAIPASAGAVTFGAALEQIPANNNPAEVCGNVPIGSLPVPGLPVGSQSCQFSYSGFGTPDTLATPITGILNSAQVKVGNVTGPMRVNVMRMLFKQTAFVGRPQVSGPFHQAFGPTFTPAPNQITTVPVNLPVLADPTPAELDFETIAALDLIALEVLAPNVPIPVFRHPGLVSSFSIYPGPSSSPPSLTGLPNFGTSQPLGVMMRADVTPAAVAAPPPVAGTPAQAALALRSTAARVRNNTAALALLCSVVDCSGTVTLQRPGARGARAELLGSANATRTQTKKKQAKPSSLGRKKFSVKAGRKATLRIKLNSRGRSLMRKKKTAKIEAVVRYANGTSSTVKLSLKR